MTPPPMVIHPEPPIPDKKRKTMSEPMFGANAQPICQMTKKQLAPVSTMRRPYISESGERSIGPTAYPRTKTETAKAAKISESLPKSMLMKPTPGANIEEASGEMKVMMEMRMRRENFFDCVKLSGMSGSSCPSQPTTLSSRFCCGMVIGGRRSLAVDILESARDTLLPPVFVLINFSSSKSVGLDLREPCVYDDVSEVLCSTNLLV